jgi:aldehyde dehydrogenase (NAD+)
LREYVKPKWEREAGRREGGKTGRREDGKAGRREGLKGAYLPSSRPPVLPSIDRTAKLYIGGKQVRPDGGYSDEVLDGAGERAGEVSRGNRKDIRNAVEAARKARGWTTGTAHNRAQVLYYVAENLAERLEEFAARLAGSRDDGKAGRREVELSIERLYAAAAIADKWDGYVHHTPYRNVTLAMPEALGVMGIACPDEAPLLAFVSTVAPAIAMGNRVIVLPSERWPLAATDLYQVLETSDVPGGVINIVTGPQKELVPVLAAHDDVDGMWHFGPEAGATEVERLSAGNMKRTWVSYGRARDWFDAAQGEGHEFLEHATQVKNIWVPYGE